MQQNQAKTPNEMVKSRRNTRITSHQGKLPSKAREIKLEATSNLSAKGSIKDPKAVSQLK